MKTQDRSELNGLLFLARREKVRSVLDGRAERCLKTECGFKNLRKTGEFPVLEFLKQGERVREKKKCAVTAVIWGFTVVLK